MQQTKMNQFMLCIIVGICGIDAFELAHPSLTFQDEFSFRVSTAQLDSDTALVDPNGAVHAVVQTHMGNIVSAYGTETANRIFREVCLMAKNHDYRSTRWTFQVNPDYATLEVFGLLARVGPDDIYFSGGRAVIRQPIPEVYDSVQQCEKTGRRRYIIGGPRNTKCNTVHVPRGLNQGEFNTVQKNLMAYATNAENGLMGRAQERIAA